MKVLSQITSNIDQNFGNSLHIDIKKIYLNQILKDENHIRKWLFDLVDKIDMKILDLQMKYYTGRDEITEGWSAIGFLDCSSISLHTSPKKSRIYLDIFSCKPISLKIVNDFIADTVRPIKVDFVLLNR